MVTRITCGKYFPVFLFFCLGCQPKKSKVENIEKVISPPRMDTMHFHIIKPPSYFVLEGYAENFVIWGNPNFHEIEKQKGITIDNLNIQYGKEEELTFFNFGRTYLLPSPESPADPLETACEKLEIKYDIVKKEYDVRYSFSEKPKISYITDSRWYHSLAQADSILKLWGAKPLREW
jgi:hypothetical protein